MPCFLNINFTNKFGSGCSTAVRALVKSSGCHRFKVRRVLAFNFFLFLPTFAHNYVEVSQVTASLGRKDTKQWCLGLNKQIMGKILALMNLFSTPRCSLFYLVHPSMNVFDMTSKTVTRSPLGPLVGFQSRIAY